MQFKTLAAAAALALAAPAFAAITPGSGAGDNTELFMVVADSTAKVSFAYDLGFTMAEFTAAEQAGTLNRSWNISADANWATFAQLANTSTAVWAVLALDNTGGLFAGTHRAITTVRAGAENLVGNTTNKQLSDGIGATQGGRFFGSINATGTHKTLANGSSVNAETDNGYGYFGKTGGLTPNLNTNAPFVSTNLIGVDASMFLVTRSGNLNGNKVLSDQFDSLQPVVASFDGNALQISAVPEPGTYALMLAGLLTVGMLARRRS